jgi:hypothetical protein
MKKQIIACYAAPLLAQGTMADTLTLRDGSKIQGTLVGSDTQQVRFLVGNAMRIYPIAQVSMVSFGDGPPANVLPAPQAPRESAMTVNAFGFVLTLQRCEKKASASVTCFFGIANQKADRDLTLWPLEMIDSSGQKQAGRRSVIGSAEGPVTILPEVPVKATITFGGVAPDVNRITRLRVNLQPRDGYPYGDPVEFRNIPLTEVPR